MNPIEELKEGLFVQKTKTGWRVVKPIKKDLSRPFSFTNNINWKHFLIGDWNRLITFLIILIIILCAAFAYRHDLQVCAGKYASECMAAKSNPCFGRCFYQCNLDSNDLLRPQDILNDSIPKNGA